MRPHFIAILLLFLIVGCGPTPDPYAAGRKYAAEQIQQVQLGYGNSLHCPPLDLFETAANDANFVKNLQELTLSGSFDRYKNVSLSSFVHLNRVTLVDTEGTRSYLEALPLHVNALILDRTDLTYGTESWQNLNDKQFIESWFQEIARFDSLETLFINPWDKRLTTVAVEVLPKLKSLNKLEPEWASEEAVSVLQKALPNCHVELITQH